GTVSLEMVGACGGCPLSMMTLKAGIERILMDRVPGVREVVASADAPGTLDEATEGLGITLPSL
ncbi:MAG: NifU family protein, partial [Acidimicrobiia bacterium]